MVQRHSVDEDLNDEVPSDDDQPHLCRLVVNAHCKEVAEANAAHLAEGRRSSEVAVLRHFIAMTKPAGAFQRGMHHSASQAAADALSVFGVALEAFSHPHALVHTHSILHANKQST